MRRRIILFLGIGVSALLLWLALRNADLGRIGGLLETAELAFAAPFLLALFAFYWLKSARWAMLLSPAARVRSHELFPVVMIGYAGTAILPMQLGELVRAWIAAKKYTLPWSLTLSSIFMERIFDLLTILALLAAVLLFGQSIPALLVDAGYVIAAVTCLGLLLSVILVRRTEAFIRTTRALLAWLPDRFLGFLSAQLGAAADGLQSINSLPLVARIALNSIAQWLLMGVCIWLSLLALDIQIPAAGVILVLVATIAGISLPTSPGYVGNIQFAFVVALQAFGVDPAAAVAASVFYHVLAYAAVVITGFFFLHRMGLSFRSVEAEARDSTPPTA